MCVDWIYVFTSHSAVWVCLSAFFPLSFALTHVCKYFINSIIVRCIVPKQIFVRINYPLFGVKIKTSTIDWFFRKFSNQLKMKLKQWNRNEFDGKKTNNTKTRKQLNLSQYSWYAAHIKLVGDSKNNNSSITNYANWPHTHKNKNNLIWFMFTCGFSLTTLSHHIVISIRPTVTLVNCFIYTWHLSIDHTKQTWWKKRKRAKLNSSDQ